MKSKLSKYLTGSRKKYSTNNTLLKIIETWDSMINKEGNREIAMDISNEFDKLNQNLLL